MNRTAKILNIIGMILIVFQLMGYLGTASADKPTDDFHKEAANTIWYHIGYNLFLIIGVILLIIAFFISRKNKKRKLQEMIDSIGKEE
jgi:LPXTG-motif cell wall-anchored protein